MRQLITKNDTYTRNNATVQEGIYNLITQNDTRPFFKIFISRVKFLCSNEIHFGIYADDIAQK